MFSARSPQFRLILFVAVIIVIGVAAFSIIYSRSNDRLQDVIEPVEDARTLPWEFRVDQKITSINEDGVQNTQVHVPVDLYGRGVTDMYHVGNNWKMEDTQSCVVFYDGIGTVNAVRQHNIRVPLIHTSRAADFDGDGILEVAVTYVCHDTAWLEVLDPVSPREKAIFIATGQDRHDDGSWDGRAQILAVLDLNADAVPEILVGVDVGYDLYPRLVAAVDVSADTVLWQHEVSGLTGPEGTSIATVAETGGIVVIVAIQSKGNSARTDFMDDSHSYVMAINADGSLRWLRESGGYQIPCHPVVSDYDSDGCRDIVIGRTYEIPSPSPDSSPGRGGAFVVIDVDGKLIDSLDLGKGLAVRSLRSANIDGNGEVTVIGIFADTSMRVFDGSLQEIGRCRFYSQPALLDSRDFLGIGEPQLLVATADGKTWLLSSAFEPLARLNARLQAPLTFPYPNPAPGKGFSIIAGANHGANVYYLSFQRTPWFSIFFRKPWLASLAAAVPVAIILLMTVVYVFRIRRKNRTILAAQEELRSTQARLIAAERFAQAKDIAGGFAHEIRNALFPARTWLSKLKKTARESSQQSEQVAMAMESVARAVDLTTTISQYTKLEAEKSTETVEAAPIISEVLRSNKARLDEMDIATEVRCPEGIKVTMNREQLYSILNNLALNAMDALTNTDREGILGISCRDEGDYVAIEVADNGCGISPENLSRVFDTFFTTRPAAGTGLGLAIVKKTVEMYGGSISVDSHEGEGTSFFLRLTTTHDEAGC